MHNPRINKHISCQGQPHRERERSRGARGGRCRSGGRRSRRASNGPADETQRAERSEGHGERAHVAAAAGELDARGAWVGAGSEHGAKAETSLAQLLGVAAQVDGLEGEEDLDTKRGGGVGA